MTRLLLVRHGETVWNSSRRLQGQEDIPLSERGKEQAQALASRVQVFKPARVVTSDLQRAVETATALGFARFCRDARLREADLGDWTGRSANDLKAQDADAYTAWREGRLTPPGAESFEELGERVHGALLEQLSGGTVLVVTHGGVIRAALARFLGLYPDKIVPVSPASLTILDIAERAKLHAYNLTSSGALEPAPD